MYLVHSEGRGDKQENRTRVIIFTDFIHAVKHYKYDFYNKTLVIHLKHASWLHVRSCYSKYANEDGSDDELY